MNALRRPLKFLVTGGRGYIGSHLCKLLTSLGHLVVSIDNYSTSPRPRSGQESEKLEKLLGKNIDVDMGNYPEMDKQLSSHAPFDGAFHFAARALVGESEANPWKYYEENIVKSISLLKFFQHLGIKKFIFSSTCATYGIPASDFINESTLQKPVNTYGFTKLTLEQIVQDLVRHQYFQVYALRYFNVAGCAPDGSLGEHHEPETHVIPNLIKSLLENSAKFSVLGDQYPTNDGTCIRDYIHVEDLVRGHWMAMEKLLQLPATQTKGFWDAINLGTGQGTSVAELLEITESITGRKISKIVAPARAGDPPCLVAEVNKAKSVLNFETKYTVKDCIEHTWNYWKDYARK